MKDVFFDICVDIYMIYVQTMDKVFNFVKEYVENK